ncbi:MerR family transcriptional regulator [Actinomadura gamaensis]|uniref:MerR family transcriptional regulator n=1 Tax=Actinomadura gamaensis TaxID=1763541 RepID=A0ABV9U4L8_9ACTN
MRITEAARRLGTSPRMLRYRERLGLLPPTRDAGAEGGHRRFGDAELRAVALALALEKRFDIGPAELAFGLRVLAEPEVQARVRELGERIGRLSAPPTRALDFEKEKALRLLRRPGLRSPRTHP